MQSDSASVEIPELELELAPGTLGGLVTTVEGLLTNISESKYEDLANIFVHASKDVTLLVLFFGCHIKKTFYLFPFLSYVALICYPLDHSAISAGLRRVHGFSMGDSAESWKKNKWEDFDSHLQKVYNFSMYCGLYMCSKKKLIHLQA